jgi:hypothetical protein
LIKPVKAINKPIDKPIASSAVKSTVKSSDRTSNFQSDLQKAQALFDKGEYPLTLEQAHQLLLLHLHHFDVIYLIAQTHANLGQYQKRFTIANKRSPLILCLLISIIC